MGRSDLWLMRRLHMTTRSKRLTARRLTASTPIASTGGELPQHWAASPCTPASSKLLCSFSTGWRTFSSMKFKQPSLGTKAAIFLPFLISWARTHLRIAELGCLASMPLRRKKRGGA